MVAWRERAHSESPSTSGRVANASARMHEEVVHARGHEHVSAEHASTFEVTSEDYLTPAGDCILGIEADRVPADFDDDFVAACQEASARISAHLAVDGVAETVTVEGRGDPALTFEGDRSLVGRTSDYVDDRTVMVGADRAAGDLPRDLVSALADGAGLTLRLRVR
jgi:hypothetical protein